MYHVNEDVGLVMLGSFVGLLALAALVGWVARKWNDRK